MLIGLLQFAIVFAASDTLGGSSSYMTMVSQWVVTERLQEIFPYLAKYRCGIGNWWQVYWFLISKPTPPPPSPSLSLQRAHLVGVKGSKWVFSAK